MRASDVQHISAFHEKHVNICLKVRSFDVLLWYWYGDHQSAV